MSLLSRLLRYCRLRALRRELWALYAELEEAVRRGEPREEVQRRLYPRYREIGERYTRAWKGGTAAGEE